MQASNLPRKIIQIGVYSQIEDVWADKKKNKVNFAYLAVLCNDGTVWDLHCDENADFEWTKLPEIPQDNYGD